MLNRSIHRGRFSFLNFSLLSALAAFSASLSVALAGDYPIIQGENSSITDGDTIVMRILNEEGVYTGETPLKLRFLHIDAPELHIKSPQGKWYAQGHWGKAAKTQLSETLPLYSAIHIEDHGIDVYGRTLAVIFDGKTNINLSMVKSGWAYPYFLCKDGECSDEYFKSEKIESYFKACSKAREQGLGVWNEEDPLTEYPFEFRLRIQERKAEKYVGDYYTGDLYKPDDYGEVDICSAVFFYEKADAEALGFKLVR